MQVRVRGALVVLLVPASLAGFTTLTAQDTPVTPPAGLIVGQVVDAGSGRPIGGAVVSLNGRPGASGNPRATPYPLIVTRADGYFVYRNLPRGNYGIAAQRAGYAGGLFRQRRPDGIGQQLTLRDGERAGDVVIRLWKHGSITGTVVDEAGEPVVGLQMRCWRRAGTTARWNPCGMAGATDDRGVYRLPSLVPGDYAVGTINRPVAASARPNENMFAIADLMLGNAAARSPVPGPAPQRTVPLLVYPPTYHPATRSSAGAALVSLESGEDRHGVDLQVEAVPTVRVSGVVVGGDETATSLTAWLVPGSDGGLAAEPEIVRVTAGGAFSFPAVPAGQYLLRAATDPRARAFSSRSPQGPTYWAEVPLTVGGDDVEGVAVPLGRGLTVGGHPEFDGSSPRPGAEELQRLAVEIEAADPTPILRIPTPSTQKDSTGRFTSGGLAPGRYYVRVLASPTGWMFRSAMLNGRDVSIRPFELGSEDVRDVVLTFTDRWTSLSGSVQSPQGTPDEGAMVLVFPTDSELWSEGGQNPRRMRGARAGPDGTYNLRSMPPGEYHAIAIPDEHAADWRDPKFLEGLSRLAMLVTIGDGEHKVQHLRTQEVR